MARLRALLRRSTGQFQPVMTIGPSQCRSAHPAWSASMVLPVSLTPLEYRMVSYLFHHRDRVVSQSELGEALYSHDNDRDSNAIEALVGRLAQKAEGQGHRNPARLRVYRIRNTPMKAGSLRLRLLVAAAISISAALFVAGLALDSLFEQQVRTRVMQELTNDLLQLAGSIDVSETVPSASHKRSPIHAFKSPMGASTGILMNSRRCENRARAAFPLPVGQRCDPVDIGPEGETARFNRENNHDQKQGRRCRLAPCGEHAWQ